MGSAAFVDTGVLVAALNARDSLHTDALAILKAADEGRLGRVLVTDFVLAETLNYLTKKVGGSLPRDFLRRILSSAHFAIERTPDAVWNEARDVIFPRYGLLSLTDALTVAHLAHRGIPRLYSFDARFDAVRGVQRIARLGVKPLRRRGKRAR